MRLVPLDLRARLLGKSLWAVRYAGGREITELDRDWLDVPQRGLVELRLHCPNGEVGVLGSRGAITGRCLQFKTAVASVSLGGPGAGHHTQAQVIGLVTGLDGECTCYAWEYGPRRLVRFTDNVRPGAWRYGGTPFTFEFAHLGTRPA